MSFSVDVLKIRNFRLLLLVRAFGLMALQAQAVIIGWQVYSITKSPFMLGLAGLTEAIPAIICALFTGHLVDIGRPHRIYFICTGALALNALLLMIFAGGIIEIPQKNILYFIFIGIFISGVARSFIMPASFKLLSHIVSREQISAASAWLNSSFQFAAISGPAIAGIVYGGYGAQVAWLLPFSLAGMGLLMIAGMSKAVRDYRSAAKSEPAFKSIVAGWKFILANRILLSVMTLDMFAVLFGGATAMLPAFADKILHVGSEGLGTLRAAPAMGSIIMALTLALIPMKRVRAGLLLVVVACFGLCMIGFGLSKTFPVAMLFLILSGIFDSVSMVMRSTMMQLLTPDVMRGRVAAVNSMFVISSNEIGAFESGLAARLLGLTPSIIAGGICTLFVVAGTCVLAPKLRKMTIKSDDII